MRRHTVTCSILAFCNLPAVASADKSVANAPSIAPTKQTAAPSLVETELREMLAARERQLETQARVNSATQEQMKQQEKTFEQTKAAYEQAKIAQRKKISQLLQRKKKEMSEKLTAYRTKIESLEAALLARDQTESQNAIAETDASEQWSQVRTNIDSIHRRGSKHTLLHY